MICGELLKMKKYRKIFAISIFVFIFILLLYGIATKSILTSKDELNHRLRNFERWNTVINNYKEQTGAVPSDLFEAIAFPGEYSGLMAKVSPYDLGRGYSDEISIDREKFMNYIDYVIAVTCDGWYVIEKRPGKLYKKRMMVNQSGEVYLIKSHLIGRNYSSAAK